MIMAEGIAVKSYLSGRALPSRSASERVSSCAAGKSAASENPSEGLLMKSFTLRGACPLLPVLLMAHELSLTAAAAQDPCGKDLKVQQPDASLPGTKRSSDHHAQDGRRIPPSCHSWPMSMQGKQERTLIEGYMYEQLLICVGLQVKTFVFPISLCRHLE